MSFSSQPTIALLHWGNLIEDFLDTINVWFASFCQEMTGGWLFGYVNALKLSGVKTVLYCKEQSRQRTYLPYPYTYGSKNLCFARS
ncbi:MAG TPA: hypothetical protein V6C71_11085 [Coleofasciculaceae cyanobacterium]|jgi:starch synthase